MVQAEEDIIEIITNLQNNPDEHYSPIHTATKFGKVDVVNALIQSGVDPNSIGKNKLTPLHIAAHYDQAKICENLIKHGAALECQAANTFTPLHSAVKKNSSETVSVLLDSKAKIDAKTELGYTPLHMACLRGHNQVADKLLANGANINMKAKNGISPLHLAVQGGYHDIMKSLLKSGAIVTAETHAGYQPIHTAACMGDQKAIEILLAHDAPMTSKTRKGRNVLHLCALNGHSGVLQAFNDQALSKERDQNGETPSDLGRRLGHVSFVKSLEILEEKIPKVSSTPSTRAPLAQNEYEESGNSQLAPENSSSQEVEDSYVMVSKAEIESEMMEEKDTTETGPTIEESQAKDNTGVEILVENEAPTEIFRLVMDLQKSFEGSPLWSPIHEAAKMDNKDVASVLIDQGSNLNLKGKNGLTPLGK